MHICKQSSLIASSSLLDNENKSFGFIGFFGGNLFMFYEYRGTSQQHPHCNTRYGCLKRHITTALMPAISFSISEWGSFKIVAGVT